MRSLFLALALTVSAPALSQALPAGVADAGVMAAAAPLPASVAPVMATDGGVVSQTDVATALDNPLGSFKNFYLACKDGKWGLAAMFLLFIVVGFFRTAGKKLHSWIPTGSTNPLFLITQDVLSFLYDTKIGGWIMNWSTAIAGCMGMAYMAGLPVDGSAWKTALLASTGGTMLIELKDDIMEWWEARKAKAVAAVAAAPAPVPAPAPVAAAPAPVAPPADPPKPAGS